MQTATHWTYFLPNCIYVVRERNIDDSHRYIGWDTEPDEDDGYEMPDYSEYIAKLERRYSTLKTLLYNDGNKLFYSFYVCNNVSVSFPLLMQMDERAIYRMHGIGREVADATPEKLRRYSKHLILTGTGGLGKSMMMRHLLLSASKAYNTEKRLPVFIPLKDYDSESGLLMHIYHCVQSICDTISQAFLRSACEVLSPENHLTYEKRTPWFIAAVPAFRMYLIQTSRHWIWSGCMGTAVSAYHRLR